MPLVTRHSLLSLALLLALATAGAAAFLWSGLYDIGADDPHTAPVYAALDTLRQRSIAARAKTLAVPNLSDADLVRQGAGNYAAMCAGCHLAPGAAPTELSRGLYPAPPNFSAGSAGDPARQFWVIKHGIKASGMPAWGKSMDDRYVWGLVALLQQLPKLDAAAYRQLVANSDGHSHDGGEGLHHEHAAAASAQGEAAADAVATVDRFGKALAAGDLEAAQALLDPQVLILESGGAEQDRAEYLAHHAGADAAFLKQATVHPGRRRARSDGDTAWVGSESEIHVREQGKPATLLATETMVLRRQADGWRIVHIHWSSARKE